MVEYHLEPSINCVCLEACRTGEEFTQEDVSPWQMTCQLPSQMIGSAEGQRASLWESGLFRHQNGPKKVHGSHESATIWSVYTLLAGPSQTRWMMLDPSSPCYTHWRCARDLRSFRRASQCFRLASPASSHQCFSFLFALRGLQPTGMSNVSDMIVRWPSGVVRRAF